MRIDKPFNRLYYVLDDGRQVGVFTTREEARTEKRNLCSGAKASILRVALKFETPEAIR